MREPVNNPNLHPDFIALRHAAASLSEHQQQQVSRLLQAHGIAGEYIEYSGHVATIPLADRLDILDIKGVRLLDENGVLDDALMEEQLRSVVNERWQQVLPPLVVLTEGAADFVTVHVPCHALEHIWHWCVQAEDGSEFKGEFVPARLTEQDVADVDGASFSARQLPLWPLQSRELPLGYHRQSVHCDPIHAIGSTTLVLAPSRCHEPDWAQQGKRLWGFSVQLYTLRSAHNWGIGDLGDLCELIPLAAGQGADFLVLNPLHALDPLDPESCSPYSPNDRRRLNPLYLDLNVAEDFREWRDHRPTAPDDWLMQLESLRSLDTIDYARVATFKYRALMEMFLFFLEHHINKNTERARCFDDYVAHTGESLQAFARFEAARTGQGEVAGDHRFTLYCQWLVEQQLEACQRLALESGMRIGLVRDLAVGGNGGGAEASMNSDLFCLCASIGAPPDPLAPQGQNWGLPPPDPRVGSRQSHQHFIDLLRSNMNHCGALRIDHVMSLMRLWWCPQHSGRGGGAYVHYPVDNLFALLRLESVRNRCLVIGEDLGVVPPEVRGYLDSSAIFSNILFYFEKYDAFHFKRPEHYTPRALAMVANHDVPTLAAWWNCYDLRLRMQLGLITDEQALEEQVLWREGERQQVLNWLGEQWLLPEGWQGDTRLKKFDYELCAAIFRCCARSASQMVSVQLEDLVLLETPVNIPGTSTEYPNWRRRLPIDLPALFAAPSTALLLGELCRERGQEQPGSGRNDR